MTLKEQIKQLEKIANQPRWGDCLNNSNDREIEIAEEALVIIKKQETTISMIKTRIKIDEIDGRESCQTIMQIKNLIKSLEEND